jgi:hypothetical protein
LARPSIGSNTQLTIISHINGGRWRYGVKLFGGEYQAFFIMNCNPLIFISGRKMHLYYLPLSLSAMVGMALSIMAAFRIESF